MTPDLPLDWKELKQRRAEIDDHECVECGNDNVLFVVSTNDEFGLTDLETRCYDHASRGWRVKQAVVDVG